MSEQQPKEGSLAEEFRELGDNLVKAMRSVWNSPERKRLESELSNGFSQLSRTLKTEADRLSSGVGHQVKAGAGEMGGRMREELVNALRAANTQLAEAASRMEARQSGEQPGKGSTGASEEAGTEGTAGMSQQPAGDVTSPAGDTGHREVHPDDVSAKPADSGHREVHPDDVES